jgi:hypothetical protein
MIKLCWWLLRTLIWGNDFKIDFNFSVDFEEAMIYLKKGYFIHRLVNENVLFVKVKGDIYCINITKGTATVIDGFTSEAMNDLWKIIPERMQTEKKFLDKD